MLVDFNWKDVEDYEFNIEGNGIYSISLAFKNGDAMTYGYTNQRAYIDDCQEIMRRKFPCLMD